MILPKYNDVIELRNDVKWSFKKAERYWWGPIPSKIYNAFGYKAPNYPDELEIIFPASTKFTLSSFEIKINIHNNYNKIVLRIKKGDCPEKILQAATYQFKLDEYEKFMELVNV